MTHRDRAPGATAALARIARQTIANAHQWSSCTCTVEDVRWNPDTRRAYINHRAGCPLAPQSPGERDAA